jgi:hypothetical protein
MEKPKLEEEQAAAMPVRFRGRAALRSIQVHQINLTSFSSTTFQAHVLVDVSNPAAA